MALQFLKQLSLAVFTKQCSDKYFDDFDFLDVQCFKQTLSKGLGIAIILGSVLVKVPQIVKIVQNKNTEGISFISVLMDLFAVTSTSAYSYTNKFPFSAWGEGLFVGLQTVIILALVLYDFKHTLKVTTFLAGYMSIVTAVVLGWTPMKLLWTCQAINTPVVVTGRIIQGYTNYKNQSTGQLSAVTLFLLFFGAAARIFTSIQETGDINMIIMYCFTTFTNGFLAFQYVYYYKNNAPRAITKETKKHT